MKTAHAGLFTPVRVGPALLLLLLAQLPAPAQGQAAVEKVKSLLAGFGVRGHLRLQQFGSTPGLTEDFTVVVTDAKGSSYTALYFQKNRHLYLHHGPEHGMLGGMKFQSLLGTAQEKRVRGWLKAVGTQEPTRLTKLTSDETGIGHAFFPILRKGYPFVSYPRYGYDFAFVVKTGEFLAYESSENTPPVDPTPPKLDKSAALAALKQLWDTKISPEAINVRHWVRVWYTVRGEPELGYYLPKGQTTAILVWRIAFVSMRDVGHAVQGGDSAMLFNAVTGEQIPTVSVP